MEEKYGYKKFFEEQIKIELDKMTSNDNSDNLNLVTKLIDGYVEYARTACFLQAVIELAQGDAWVSVIKGLLLESDVDDDVKQELLEHTISCQRLNSCDAISSHHKIIDKCSIQADFELREDTYIITALLSNEYVSKNNLSTCFYMGVVVSDCSNETKRRKNRLVLSEDETQWYNPIYFARVDVD